MQKISLLDHTFNLQLSENKRKNSLRWAAVNLCFFCVIFADIKLTQKYLRESLVYYYIECVASAILLLSFITNILTYMYYSWFTDKIVCDNETQRILLNISNSSIVRTAKPKVHAPAEKQNETVNIRNLSYQTYSERKLCRNLRCFRFLTFVLFSKFNSKQLDEQHFGTVEGLNFHNQSWRKLCGS